MDPIYLNRSELEYEGVDRSIEASEVVIDLDREGGVIGVEILGGMVYRECSNEECKCRKEET